MTLDKVPQNLRMTTPDKNLAFTLDPTKSFIQATVPSTTTPDTTTYVKAPVGSEVFLGPNYGQQAVDTVNLKMPLGIYFEVTEEMEKSSSAAFTGLTVILQSGTKTTHATTGVVTPAWTDVQTIYKVDDDSGKISVGNEIQLVQIGKLTGTYARLVATIAGADEKLGKGKVLCYMSPIISNTPAGGYKDRRSINVFGESS